MICERIKETRERTGLTQAALAKKLGISRSAVNSWEIGVSAPSVQYLIELSKLFKVSADYLLELNTGETLDISYLDEEEKRMIYLLLDYFKKYGSTMRNINKQVEDNYEAIKELAIKEISDDFTKDTVKTLMNELMNMTDLFD